MGHASYNLARASFKLKDAIKETSYFSCLLTKTIVVNGGACIA
jgi:hypothetical protein